MFGNPCLTRGRRAPTCAQVQEDVVEKSVTLRFEGGGELDGKMKLSFPTEQPAVLFFRQVGCGCSRVRLSRPAEGYSSSTVADTLLERRPTTRERELKLSRNLLVMLY